MKIGKILLLLAMVAGVAFADPIPTEALTQSGLVMRDRQLRDIGLVMRGGRGGFVDIGYTYTPSSEQLQLKSKYGVHDGFAFRHHYGIFGSWALDSVSHLGFLTWFDRVGWDAQDFFFFPHYGDFAHISSSFTWGFSYTNTKYDVTAALGLQHQNLELASHKVYPNESDSLLFYWAHARYKNVSLQASFYRNTFQTIRLSLDLESRSLYGGVSSGYKTFLPNLSATIYRRKTNGDDDNFVRLNWEQNLYEQVLYADVSFDFPDDGFRSAALKFYPVPSRLLGIEASCLRRQERSGAKDLLWGGAIDLFFLRLGYNTVFDYENMFHAKGTLIAEIKVSMGKIGRDHFGRGASQPAPMVTTEHKPDLKKILKARAEQQNLGSTSIDAQGNKVIEAKGIRYEKVDGSATQGGN
ncbi:hypothetical protein B7982_02340 [Fibrobacter sp. UWB2]|uniref:hypothetical protein n=1 Tax=Fibrobacter sp. UWB2 TaxID=1964358 RepID=UPI000B52471F|nr:hypothetical protein [Fibrobacter sp. UWB2]OWV24574.1 hypothetical protein B7982_02340 [Fibrobacter sp. UWB2]